MRLLLIFTAVSLSVGVPLPVNVNYMRKTLLRLPTRQEVSCDICKATVYFAHTAFELGYGKKKLMKGVTYICNKFKIETNRVCEMVIREFVDEIWGVFVLGFFVPDEICGVIFGDSCAQPRHLFPSWNITIPPPTMHTPMSSDVGVEKGSTPTYKILQISDTHLDNDYKEGSEAQCLEPLCCRANDGPAVHQSAGKYGYPGYCDSNILLVQSMFSHIAENHSDIEYILWTGDVPAHNIWNQSRTGQVNSIRQATSLFQKFFPTKRVFPTVGNHEGVPVNSFPPPSLQESQKKTIGDQWLYDTLADDWSYWLPDDVIPTIKKGGYYTALVKKGLRIVSLNTNYGSSDNWWLVLHSRDPAGQLQWLVSVLLQAEEAGEKVHIIGHIPPNEQLKWWSFNFYRIVDRFQHTITAQFYGHTHHDEFRLFYDMKTYEIPTNVAYLGPSVTTYHHLNPGYRMYEIDGVTPNSSMSVVDHHTFILDLMKTKKTGKAEWELEYSAKSSYGLEDLSASAWNNLIQRMIHDDALFQKYFRAFTKQHVRGTCGKLCKMRYLCSMKTAMSGIHDFCNFTTNERHLYSTWLAKTYDKC